MVHQAGDAYVTVGRINASYRVLDCDDMSGYLGRCERDLVLRMALLFVSLTFL